MHQSSYKILHRQMSNHPLTYIHAHTRTYTHIHAHVGYCNKCKRTPQEAKHKPIKKTYLLDPSTYN